MSITYIFVLLLTIMGVDNAEQVVEAVLIVALAIGALWGRWRAGGLHWSGFRK